MQPASSSDKDQNFDGLVEHFEKKIYGTMKGELRLKLIKQDLLKQIPQLTTHTLRVLDVAGGLGQIAIWLAEMGHQVIVADISAEMIQRSQQIAEVAGVKQQIKWIQSPLQQLHPYLIGHKLNTNFDLIIAHAILEWMANPAQGFSHIVDFARSKTQISLTFYNRQAIVLHNVLRGNFRKVNSDNFRGDLGGLTPLNPLNPDDVRSWVNKHNLILEQQSGLRCCYDYLPNNIKQKISDEDILEMEIKLSKQQPFIDMARYLHFILHKN